MESITRLIFTTVLSAGILLALPAQAQQAKPGCMDPSASNYDPDATISNGSCIYSSVSYTPGNRIILPNTLQEISGAAYWQGKIWALNDGGNPAALYALDTATGAVTATVNFTGITNVDWEALAQNDTAFFIGDVGNNAAGNRTNLRVYIVPKLLITGDALQSIDVSSLGMLQFAYEDQEDFTSQGGNSTRFDCESMIFFRDSLHLFTKNWVGNYAVHYVLPAVAGTADAVRLDSFYTGGQLLTDAAVAAHDEIVFTSYSKAGQCQLLMLYGFGENKAFVTDANKRWIRLPSSLNIGQLEAVCFLNPVRGWLGSERLSVSLITVSQRMYDLNTLDFILPFYRNQPNRFAEAGMLRYNTDLQVYEAFDGNDWRPLHN